MCKVCSVSSEWLFYSSDDINIDSRRDIYPFTGLMNSFQNKQDTICNISFSDNELDNIC